MSWLTRFLLRLTPSLLYRERDCAELDEEIRFHLDQETQLRVERGEDPETARRSAIRDFGNRTRAAEDARAEWGWTGLEAVAQDLRYGLRQLRQDRTATVATIGSLALGIAATVTIFSVVSDVLLRPLPYPHGERLGMLWTESLDREITEQPTSYPIFEDWEEQSASFEAMSAFWPGSFLLRSETGTERLEGALVSTDFFSLLGVPLELGRTFSEDEQTRAARVVVISAGLWKRRFGGSKNILGEVIEFDTGPAQVIGVMPEGFEFPTRGTELWKPLTLWPNWDAVRANRRLRFWNVIGRLKEGVEPAAAQSELSEIARRLAVDHPRMDGDKGIRLVPLRTQINGPRTGLILWLLLAAASTVLLIASANAASLLLSRAIRRRREIAVRSALGASKRRLLRQMLTESLAMALSAGALGLLLAAAALRALPALAPPDIAWLRAVGIDPPVLMFSVAASLLVGVLFGLTPALQSVRTEVGESLKEHDASFGVAGDNGNRARAAIVTLQVALAVVLVTCTGLLSRSLLQLQAVNPGFASENVLTMRLAIPPSLGPARWSDFYSRALKGVRALPDVRAAGIAFSHFARERDPQMPVTIEGDRMRSEEFNEPVFADPVSPGYFATLRTPLIAGRLLSDRDDAKSPRVVVVNETMARRFWPGLDPVGRRIKFGRAHSTQPWLTVVGVVGDMRRRGLDRNPLPQVFQPFQQSPLPGMDMFVLTEGAPEQTAPLIRARIRSVEDAAALTDLSSLEAQLWEFGSSRRFQTWLLTLFSAASLMLAAVGVYGLMHYSVTSRRREIGLRIALGADRREILGGVVADGLRLAIFGLAIGIAGAAALTGFFRAMLFDVSPTDPLVFTIAGAVLLTTAALASYLPARRAASTDPLQALRSS